MCAVLGANRYEIISRCSVIPFLQPAGRDSIFLFKF
jgi:hypothetical protein